MAERKRIVLVGAGRIAQVHAKSIKTLGRARIAAVVDPSRDVGESLAADVGGKWYSTLDELPAGEAFEGAIIAAPTGLHASLIETCVQMGWPVLCEKPVDLSIERVDQCIERVRAAGVPVLIAFHRRFDAARREVHGIVQSGALGRIEHILQISRDPRLPSESFIAHSGGMVRDMLVHDFDELVWFCGSGAVSVQADVRRFVDPPLLAKYDDVDTVAVTIVFEEGPQCQLSASRRSVYGFDQRLEVFGSAGMVSCPSMQTSSIVRSGPNGFLSAPLLDYFPQRYEAAYVAEMENFLDMLSGKAEPVCTIVDARASLALAELVLESARSGHKTAAANLHGSTACL
jgi:myo-inositol 2-dehydrogenase/D-chiro-inositol 1-dehydrogenase